MRLLFESAARYPGDRAGDRHRHIELAGFRSTDPATHCRQVVELSTANASQSELASLILSTPIENWQEQGHLRLLSNGEAQLDVAVQLQRLQGPTADLRISIQGSWLLSDGFLILKSSHYTALPFNDSGKQLLARHAQPLRDIWLTLFNRSVYFSA